MRQSVTEQARASEVIFIGRAIRTERADRFDRITTFRISETLKGGRASTRRISHWQNDGANCGVSFRKGQRILVAARRTEGKLETNACTMPMGSEAEFRRALRRR